jgi:2-keto-3-deoxy-6-phosphogluconate aldolase
VSCRIDLVTIGEVMALLLAATDWIQAGAVAVGIGSGFEPGSCTSARVSQLSAAIRAARLERQVNG